MKGKNIIILLLIVFVIFLLFLDNIQEALYRPNPEDAFSAASGFALSQMYANTEDYFCPETDNKKASYWYKISVSEIQKNKYYVIGATRAFNQYCIYTTGYFATTVYFGDTGYGSKDWQLDGKISFSGNCLIDDSLADWDKIEIVSGECTYWKHDWKPDMNWTPFKY